ACELEGTYGYAKSLSDLVALDPLCQKLLDILDNLRRKFNRSHHDCTPLIMTAPPSAFTPYFGHSVQNRDTQSALSYAVLRNRNNDRRTRRDWLMLEPMRDLGGLRTCRSEQHASHTIWQL